MPRFLLFAIHSYALFSPLLTFQLQHIDEQILNDLLLLQLCLYFVTNGVLTNYIS